MADENPWKNPEHARALGLVLGFHARTGTVKPLREMMNKLGHPADLLIKDMCPEDVVVLSRMIEGYVDASGLLR